MNVLVTAIGGDLGQGVLKSLRLLKYKPRIVGTDITPTAPGLFLADKGYVVEPVTNEKKFLWQIVKICRKEKIDIVFVCFEKEQFLIAAHLGDLALQTKAYFLVQPYSVLKMCQNKLKLYRFLARHGVRIPATAATKPEAGKLIRKFAFPLVIKSRRGSGSRSFRLINSKREFGWWWRNTEYPILQEHIANRNGDEFTVGVFLDKKARALGSIAMKRELKGGVTIHAIVDEFPRIEALAAGTAEAIGAIGPCNVQIRMDKNNQPCIIEVNARISGTAIFRSKLGFNEAGAAIDYFMFNKRPQLRTRKAVVMKIWDELIIDPKKYEFLKRRGYLSAGK
ncbi:MAG: ATP-grasp domain-containing protein [bacterium]|nr:ATP-grasp domain-containing protein [bacterium]MDZ4346215.1 ATP-grasp domain-containing protein [Candidatus Binatia bacterium]